MEPENNCTTEEEDSFTSPAPPSPPPRGHCSAGRVSFRLERVPLTQKEEWGKRQHPSLSGHRVMIPLHFHPLQPARLRRTERARNKEESRGCQQQPPGGVAMVRSNLFCRQTWQISPPKKRRAQLPWASHRFYQLFPHIC